MVGDRPGGLDVLTLSQTSRLSFGFAPKARGVAQGLIPKCGGLIRARPRCQRIIGQRHFFRYWFVNAWLVGIRAPTQLVWVEPVILHYCGGARAGPLFSPPAA